MLQQMLSAYGINTTLQSAERPHPDCFQIPLSKIRKANSLQDANATLKHFDDEFKKRSVEVHHPAADTYRLVSQLARMSAIGFSGPRSEKLRVGFGFSPNRTSIFRVFVGDCGGSHFRKSFIDGDGIFIDINELIKSCIFCVFCLFPKKGLSYLPAFIVAFSQNFPRTSLPFQDALFWKFLLQYENEFLNVLNNVVNFIVLHEFGHIYTDQNSICHEGFQVECLNEEMRHRYVAGSSDLKSILPVGSVWTSDLSPEMPIVVALDWMLYSDTKKKLYLPQGAESFREEMFCDYFSIFHLLFVSGTPSRSNLKVNAGILTTIFGLYLYLQEINYFSKEGMHNFKVENLSSTLEYSREYQELDTHPRSFIRWQSMALSANLLLGESHLERNALPEKDMRFGIGLFGQTNLLFSLLGSQSAYNPGVEIEFSNFQINNIEECGLTIRKFDGRWSRLPDLFKLFLWHAYAASMYSRNPNDLASMDQIQGDGPLQMISFLRGSLSSVFSLEMNPIERYWAENPSAYRKLLDLYGLGEPIKTVIN